MLRGRLDTKFMSNRRKEKKRGRLLLLEKKKGGKSYCKKLVIGEAGKRREAKNLSFMRS